MRVLPEETHLDSSDIPLAGNAKHLGIDARDNALIRDEAPTSRLITAAPVILGRTEDEHSGVARTPKRAIGFR